MEALLAEQALQIFSGRAPTDKQVLWLFSNQKRKKKKEK